MNGATRWHRWASGAMVLAIGIGAGACTSSRPLAMPAEGAAHARGGDWFVQKGCTACHSISVYGVWNLAAQAPDLSLAVEDVPRRFGRPLEDFLREPTGTMAMVLSSRIRLSEADTRVAIEKLEEAYALHQRQRAMTGRPVSSHDDNGRVAQDLTPRGR